MPALLSVSVTPPRPAARSRRAAQLRRETRLTDLLADPIMDRLVSSDGLRPEAVRRLVSDMRRRLGYRP